MKKGKNIKKYLTPSILLILIVVFILFWAFSSENIIYQEPEQNDSSGREVYVGGGGEGKLYVDEETDKIPVATSGSHVYELIDKPILTGDLHVQGKIYLVDFDSKVLVLDNKIDYRKIRVLEGEHNGRVGWVPYNWVVN